MSGHLRDSNTGVASQPGPSLNVWKGDLSPLSLSQPGLYSEHPHCHGFSCPVP